MTNRSESRGRSEMDKHGDMKSGSSHVNQGTSKSDTGNRGNGSMSGSKDSADSMRQSGQSQHTNAGSTGTGSGQISPQTHGRPGMDKSSKSGSDRNNS